MQVTVGLPGSGADYEVTLGSAQVEIIRALDQVEAAGGGAVQLQSGEYLTNAPIRWEYTKTRLAGEGIDLTTLANVADVSEL